ncbi:MAG TPA: tRNA lysidine(34) synthetase TilS [Sedimentisphaerales bacterium]|nr:tRNA lysidine(34) synthetase TilS [Sedimentisphaerales bacterium]HRS10186.1 tRNA lysidine(34) synthetase TilS [Sedimentisphaerales bacterium]HRV46892.1 tRNA lysidine(34) synthetase TilS [Sedimentisphaerales bacterium]
MEPLEQKALEFVQNHALLAGVRRVLVAVSGGADSIALLHVMHRLTSQGAIGVELLCAHVNHKLRGAASDGDEAFVIGQARELGLPVVTGTIDVKGYAREHHLSIETAARQLRLDSLAEIARAHHCTAIATGHQKDDNAETVLQRIERGTGLRGLGGIWPSRRAADGVALVRPLLDCSRVEIVEYLRSRDLSWREDHTNTDCIYTRNRIRHRLLPALQAVSDSPLVEELASLAASARRLHARVAEEARTAATRYVSFGGEEAGVDAAALAGLPEPVRIELLRQMLTRLGLGERDLTRRHYRSLLGLAGGVPAGRKVSLPDGFFAQRNRNTVLLCRLPGPRQPLPDPVELRIPGTTRFGPYRIDAQILDTTRIEPSAITNETDPFIERLDFDSIKPPLTARMRRPGDRFVPLGQHREKKVGKFLTAARVPDSLRLRTFVIEDGETILWVCPLRISDRAKVTERTSVILDLRITEI